MDRFVHFIEIFFAVVLLSNKGKAEVVIWKEEQGVSDYTNYASISPVRFSIPRGKKEAVWSFRAAKDPESCDDKTVSVYLQFGSLPVVNPLNEMFPERFYLGRSHLTHLNLTSNNVSVAHSELFPQVGDWYAIALIPERSNQIIQKGLTVLCQYKFSASLELKDLPPYWHVTVNKPQQVLLTGSHDYWVGFTVPTSALSVDFHIRNCSIASCVLQLSTIDDENGQLLLTNCSSVDNCSLHLATPLFGVERYVNLHLSSSKDALVSLEVITEDCLASVESTNSTLSCRLESRMSRYQGASGFNTDFVIFQNSTVQKTEFLASNTSITMIPFVVEKTSDIGGTLSIKIAFKSEVSTEQQVRVCGQVTVNRFPLLMNVSDVCGNATNSLEANTNRKGEDGSVSSDVYIPYPEEGLWVLALSLQCYEDTARNSVKVVDCLNGTQNVMVTAKIESCVDGNCNGQGVCKEYIKSSDFIVYSSCDCIAGWRGYGCTDGREAFSDSSQLLEVLLLTLSNLFFLPAIAVAFYRRHYIEAIVYFYNMFFSTFYHACDGDRVDKYVYCLTSYSVLAVGDFLASTCSLWVTLIAMAQIPLDFSSAIQMAGPLALVVGILLDRHSLWVIAVPTAVGLLLVIVCWVRQCWSRKHCFPSKLHYLWMLPGVLFAVAGAIMFAFFETDENYKYVHSAWHVCLAVCIIFLLPPHRKKKVLTSVNFDDTESTEGLVLGQNAFTRRMNFEL